MKLSSVAIEARNAHSLCIVLIESGWIPAKPDFDEGIDLMAWHEKRGEMLAIDHDSPSPDLRRDRTAKKSGKG